MLTGDKNLRIKATNEGVMVSGILYLTDMMVYEKVVAPLDMADYLEELLRTNNRLPEDSIQIRIDTYRRQKD